MLIRTTESCYMYKTPYSAQWVLILTGVLDYATTVFESNLGFDGTLSRFLTAWLGTEYFLAAVLALFVVDKLGRRNLMMWGAAGMAGSLAIIGGCLAYATPDFKGPAYAATVFIFVYDTFFALGWLGVTWVGRLLMWKEHRGANIYGQALSGRGHTDSYSC